jgi:hypothetical protein
MHEFDILTAIGIILMSVAHIWSQRVTQLDAVKTRSWVSFSAGASVAYVFVHVFPEIGLFQQQILGKDGGHGEPVAFFNQPLYFAALVGLCLLFLLNSIESKPGEGESEKSSLQYEHYMKLFWIKAGFYGLYNLMVAYIITRRHGEGFLNILLISIGLMFHFVVVNTRFIEMYDEFFQKYVRWVAVAGLLLGWLLGAAVKLPDATVATTFAFIGGMITYVALKSELAETGNKAPFHFLAGALVFALIILAIPFFGFSTDAVH